MTLSLMTLAKIALPALALTAALSQPARADLVIKGRAAQALRFAAVEVEVDLVGLDRWAGHGGLPWNVALD